MVSAVAVIGLVGAVSVHTVMAALLTRFFRVKLATTWGSMLFALTVGPFILLVSTLVLSGFLKLGPDLGGTYSALFVMIGVPMAIGLTIDYIWMPAPDDVERPEPR